MVIKKLLAVAITLSLGLVTVGCSDSKPSSEKKAGVVTPETAPIPNPAGTSAPAAAPKQAPGPGAR